MDITRWSIQKWDWLHPLQPKMDLRKNHYEQNWWRWWNFNWAISNPKRWSYESAALYLPANLENSAVATRLEKVCFHSNLKERQCQRMLKYCTIVLISQASKVMLKILQARLQQYVNCELWDVQTGFRKGRGTRNQIANIHWIIEKAREFQKNIYLCFTDYVKAFDCVDHNKCGKLSSGHRPGKGQFSFQSQRKVMPKNVQITEQLHSSYMLAK